MEGINKFVNSLISYILEYCKIKGVGSIEHQYDTADYEVLGNRLNRLISNLDDTCQPRKPLLQYTIDIIVKIKQTIRKKEELSVEYCKLIYSYIKDLLSLLKAFSNEQVLINNGTVKVSGLKQRLYHCDTYLIIKREVFGSFLKLGSSDEQVETAVFSMFYQYNLYLSNAGKQEKISQLEQESQHYKISYEKSHQEAELLRSENSALQTQLHQHKISSEKAQQELSQLKKLNKTLKDKVAKLQSIRNLRFHARKPAKGTQGNDEENNYAPSKMFKMW